MENTFFAIRTSTPGDKTIVKALQTDPVGPFDAIKSLSMRGEYPFAWFNFKDQSLPVDVNMEAFNFLIPFDEKNSAIPCAIFNISVLQIIALIQ
ncbi:MAG: GH116 family glycosyl-hydrolase [Candidatus Paceibacterales bacterium]